MSNAAAAGPIPLWPGLPYALLGAVAFSGKAIIVKLAYRHGVDAMTLLMLRMLFALPLFLALTWWAGRDRPPLSGSDRLAVAGLGFSGYYLASFLDFAGLQYISASLERLILYLTPTVVWLIGYLRHRWRVQPRQLWAMAVSYGGVLLVFGHELDVQRPHLGLGVALVFASMLSYGVYLAFSAEVVQRLGAMRLTGWATSIACVLCIGQYLLWRPWSQAWVSPEVVQLSMLNALACTFLPVLAVMLAIERLGAAMTSQVGMIGPISTILMGVWLLDEPFTVWMAAGTCAVLAGVALLARWR